MKKKLVIAVLILFIAAVCYAVTSHDPWNGSAWDGTAPSIDEPIGDHYKEMYDLRLGIGIRMNKEHETLATSSAGGVHKQGSARAFFQDAAPGTQVNGDAFDSGDLGSFWFDTNASPDNQFNVLTATTPTWTPISTEIIAVLLASNRQFAGTLTVDGATTLTGAVGAAASITLGGGADLIGSSTSDITIDTTFTVAGATGNTVIAGTCDITGNTDITGTLGVTGVATLGDTVVGGSLTATSGVVSLLSAYDVNDSNMAALVKSEAYLAMTDGMVVGHSGILSTADYIKLYVGTDDDPKGNGLLVGEVQSTADYLNASVNCLVAAGEYFEVRTVVATPTIYWKSFGTLSRPVNQ